MDDKMNNDDNGVVPTSNFGQLRSGERLHTEDERSPLTTQEPDRWESAVIGYHEYIRGTKSLESKYRKLKPTRQLYFIVSGIIIWFTIAALILVLPLTVALGWDNLSKGAGYTILVLSVEAASFSLIPLIISCWIGTRKRLPNPVYFFPNHVEVFVIALHLLTVGVLLVIHGCHPEIVGLSFGAFITILILCVFIALRIVFLCTPYPLTYLTLTGLFAISIIGYYMELEGILHGTHWWTSFFGPSMLLAIFCIVAAIHFVRLTLKYLRSHDGRALPWGFSFCDKFVAAVSKGPFLFSQVKKRRKIHIASPQQKEQPSKLLHESEETELHKQKSLVRLQHYELHLKFLRTLHHGYAIGAVGWIILGVGIIFGGIYMSRHYSTIPTHSIIGQDIELNTTSLLPPLPVETQSGGLKETVQGKNLATKAEADVPRTARKKRIEERKKRLMKRRDRYDSVIPDELLVDHSEISGNEIPLKQEFNKGNELLDVDQSFEKQTSIEGPLDTDTGEMNQNLEHENMSLASMPQDKQISFLRTEEIQEQEPGGLFRDILMTETLIGSDSSWWIAVCSLIMGVILLTQAMVNLLGSWMEYLAFAFLDTTNRNISMDLHIPDKDITDPQFLESSVSEKAKTVLTKLQQDAHEMFMSPKFEGCALPSPEKDTPT